MHIVLRHQTGVFYQQQYGGTACRQGQVEGFLVPGYGPDSLTQLRGLFERHFRGAGTWNYRWKDDEIVSLRKTVADIMYWASDELGAGTPSRLQLDEQRLSEAEEAWILVLMPDGPGILVWPNSD